MSLLYLGETYFGDFPGGFGAFVPPPPPPLPSYGAIVVRGLRVGGDAAPSSEALSGGVTWILTGANGAPKTFIERTPDYIEIGLAGENGAPVDPASFSAIRASLRDQRGMAFNGRDGQDVYNVNGGAWLSGGRFRLSLSASDMVSRGTQEYQLRELTLQAEHSDGVPWHWVFFFHLRNLRSIS